MTTSFPVRVDVRSPLRFDRLQLLLRVVLACLLGWIGITGGWVSWVLYLGLPVVAAIAISSVGHARFAQDVAPRLWRVLDWLLQLSAYMLLLVDRFPTGDDHAANPVKIETRWTGSPSMGSALGRLIMSIPSALVLTILGCVSGLLWLIAALTILLSETVPSWILGFQRGMLRWQARLIGYHASLIEEYPPFSLDMDAGDATSARLVTTDAR